MKYILLTIAVVAAGFAVGGLLAQDSAHDDSFKHPKDFQPDQVGVGGQSIKEKVKSLIEEAVQTAIEGTKYTERKKGKVMVTGNEKTEIPKVIFELSDHITCIFSNVFMLFPVI